jgi:hypothetical protein
LSAFQIERRERLLFPRVNRDLLWMSRELPNTQARFSTEMGAALRAPGVPCADTRYQLRPTSQPHTFDARHDSDEQLKFSLENMHADPACLSKLSRAAISAREEIRSKAESRKLFHNLLVIVIHDDAAPYWSHAPMRQL